MTKEELEKYFYNTIKLLNPYLIHGSKDLNVHYNSDCNFDERFNSYKFTINDQKYHLYYLIIGNVEDLIFDQKYNYEITLYIQPDKGYIRLVDGKLERDINNIDFFYQHLQLIENKSLELKLKYC